MPFPREFSWISFFIWVISAALGDSTKLITGIIGGKIQTQGTIIRTNLKLVKCSLSQIFGMV